MIGYSKKTLIREEGTMGHNDFRIETSIKVEEHYRISSAEDRYSRRKHKHKADTAWTFLMAILPLIPNVMEIISKFTG